MRHFKNIRRATYIDMLVHIACWRPLFILETQFTHHKRDHNMRWIYLVRLYAEICCSGYIRGDRRESPKNRLPEGSDLVINCRDPKSSDPSTAKRHRGNDSVHLKGDVVNELFDDLSYMCSSERFVTMTL